MDLFSRGQRAAAEVERGTTLGASGPYERGLSVLDDVVRQYSDDTQPGVRAAIANALFNKGVLLSAAGREHDALQTWRELCRRSADDADPIVVFWVVRALFNVAGDLYRQGQMEQAVAHYADVVQRCEPHGEERFVDLACIALSNLGLLLHEHGEHARAVQICRALLAKLEAPRAGGPPRENVVYRIQAFGVLGGALGNLGDHDAALAALDRALECLAQCDEPDRIERTVSLLNNKGVTLRALRRDAEAVACFDAATDLATGRSEPAVLRLGARALLNKAITLGDTRGAESELATLSTVIERYVSIADGPLIEIAVSAMRRSIARLHELGRASEAQAMEARLEKLGEQLGDVDDRHRIANALLSQVPQVASAADRIDLLDAAAATLGSSPDVQIDALGSANARLGKGVELARQRRFGEAIAVWDEVIQQLSSRQDEAATVARIEAMLNRAGTLGTLACTQQALSDLAAVVASCESFAGPSFSSYRLKARNAASQLQRWAAEKRAAFPGALGLEETIAVLRADDPGPAAADSRAPKPHFMQANVVSGTLAAQVRYATHDRQRQREGETGMAMVFSLTKSIEKHAGKKPSALVLQASERLEGNVALDTNFQLMAEGMAVFGLPLHVAAQHTHIGQCSTSLGLPLHDVGVIAGTFIFNFERDEGTG